MYYSGPIIYVYHMKKSASPYAKMFYLKGADLYEQNTL